MSDATIWTSRGARLLVGARLGSARLETRARLLALLDDAARLDELARGLARDMGAVADPFAAAANLIGHFKTGLREL